MIIALFCIGIALAWLLKETNLLRIHLPVGAEIKVKRESWDLIKSRLRIPDKQAPFWYKHPESPPICGWNWIETTQHVIPETKIELVTETAKFTIKSDNAAALRDAFRVYRNPYLKVKLA
jgi:hypothetical protein